MADSSSTSQGAKNFVLIMLLLCLGAGGTAWYLYNEADSSVSSLRSSQVDVIVKAAKIKQFYRPSLANYFSMVRQGEIIEAPGREEKDETVDGINQICREQGLKQQQYTNTPDSRAASGSRGSKKNYIESWVECKLVGVTRSEYENILRKARERFNLYATISDLRIDLNNSKPTYEKFINESSIRWTVSFRIVWYDEAPNA